MVIYALIAIKMIERVTGWGQLQDIWEWSENMGESDMWSAAGKAFQAEEMAM